ncbi:hypothetical protein [Streptosporangium sp. NPDC051022]|uniref:hypothetical protein n=1 Tax=Streptosporangium sp. NPDC051022 TaxID=3155752 RepID=UPI00342703EC
MSPSSDLRTVLVVSSGDGTGLNFSRSLDLAGGYRTVGVDTTLEDFHASEADTRYLISWDDPAGLVKQVNDIAERESADLIYAADTSPELLALAEARDDLAAPTLLPDRDDHRRMEDKWTTHQALQRAGIPVPDTLLVTSESDLERIMARHPRVWMRRRSGSGGAGSIATGSMPLARAWLDEQSGWGQFTAAENLSKRTATLSGLWNDGELVCSQLRERVSWKYSALSVSGVTGITGAQRTFWDEDLHELAVRCVRAVCARPHGIIGVDFTYDHDGRALPTEVQPARFYSSIYFLARLGLNMPDLYCRLALDGAQAMPDALPNPIRESHYWVKSVDKLPRLLSPEEFSRG